MDDTWGLSRSKLFVEQKLFVMSVKGRSMKNIKQEKSTVRTCVSWYTSAVDTQLT